MLNKTITCGANDLVWVQTFLRSVVCLWSVNGLCAKGSGLNAHPLAGSPWNRTVTPSPSGAYNTANTISVSELYADCARDTLCWRVAELFASWSVRVSLSLYSWRTAEKGCYLLRTLQTYRWNRSPKHNLTHW